MKYEVVLVENRAYPETVIATYWTWGEADISAANHNRSVDYDSDYRAFVRECPGHTKGGGNPGVAPALRTR